MKRINFNWLWCLIPFSSTTALEITRGPYLQNQSPTSITIKWRTDLPSTSAVHWGNESNQLNESLILEQYTTEHEVNITNLTPGSKTYYAVGTHLAILAGADDAHYFISPPIHGSKKPFRFWVLGDSGTANANAQSVRDSYFDYALNDSTHLWFMLGDNAYTRGTDSQYQAAVFNMYSRMLKKAALWPVIGNHDAINANSILGEGIYYDVFTLPKEAFTNGYSTGADSGTEAYYSFDYANVHFIMLESNETSASFRSVMETWLKYDLNNSRADWTIAMWHHPPYTMGSHNSDNESRHIYIRENIIPILESYGVDLILGGHSHSYERSWLINGHYGLSTTFNPDIHIIDSNSGNPEIGSAYLKQSLGSTPHDGSVYVVAGSSGKVSHVNEVPHPVMRNIRALKELGSLVVDVNGHNLEVKFLKANGQIEDLFRIVKGDLIFSHSFINE